MSAALNFLLENPFILFIVFFAFIGLLGYFANKRRIEKLREMASLLGLHYAEGEEVPNDKEWQISGTYNGNRIELFGKSEGHGKSRQTNTYVVTYFRKPHPHIFSISKDHAVFKLLSFILPQDVEIGDESLDTKYYLKGESAEKLKTYLKQPGVENSLDELFAFSPMISVQQDGIWAKYPGHLVNDTKAREVLDMLANHVRKLANNEE